MVRLGSFWAALIYLLAPLIFLQLSQERLRAWLAGTHATEAALLKGGWYPVYFDFRTPEQLIGQTPSFAHAKFSASGLALQTTAERFDLRLALRARVLVPQWIDALVFTPQVSAPGRWFWIVREHADGPDWVAALPEFDRGVVHADLLQFKEQNGAGVRTWSTFATWRFVRLYGEFPVGTRIVLPALGFRLAPGAIRAFREYPAEQLGRPEPWLQRFELARNADPGLLTPAGNAPGLLHTGWLAGLLLSTLVLAGYFRQERMGIWLALVLIWAPGFVLIASLRIGFGQPQMWVLLTLGLSTLLAFSRPALSCWWGKRRAWLEVLALTLIAAAPVLLSFGIPQQAPDPLRFLGYLAFAALQQGLLQIGLLARLERQLPPALAAALAACLFALWHTPNFMLMCLCLAGAAAWCWHFQRHRALLPLMLSHALLGWLVVASVPPDWLRNAEVSARFFELGASQRAAP